MVSLGPEQAEAAACILDMRENVLLHGCAGTGKSAVIQHVRSHESWDESRHFVTATTGCAAVLIGGVTLHSLLGIDFKDSNVDSCVAKLRRKEAKVEELQRIERLVIDEISMLGKYFYTASEVLKRIRGSREEWGGIRLVCSGDFLQLPPVGQRENCNLFDMVAWKQCRFRVCMLTRVYRQPDPEYCGLLHNVRMGCPSATDMALLYSRAIAVPPDVHPTLLMTHKRECEMVNEREFRALEGQPVCYPTVAGATRSVGAAGTLMQHSVQKLADDAGIPTSPRRLALKRDTQVMLTINIDGKANGSRGVVVDFTTPECAGEYGTLGLRTESMLAERARFTEEDLPEYARGLRLPVVQWHSGGQPQVVLPHFWFRDVQNNTVWVRALPLVIAYACTIHKSQGATMDCVHVNLSRGCFERGQLYTALSRVKGLASLYITMSPNQELEKSMLTDEKVVEWVRGLQQSRPLQ